MFVSSFDQEVPPRNYKPNWARQSFWNPLNADPFVIMVHRKGVYLCWYISEMAVLQMYSYIHLQMFFTTNFKLVEI
ncbi:MAG: hypothetical protein IPP38_12315 [Bacteroidetes bacterium]|nr:hypothetical protein [Bacteroidota bacterium]